MNFPAPGRFEVRLFRWALGLYLILYYATLAPELNLLFSNESMVNRELFLWRAPTILPMLPNWGVTVAFVALFPLLAIFAWGALPRVGLIALLGLHISFHNFNPFIVHEPQQLSNLFLLSFLFLPLNDAEDPDPWIARSLVVALAVYYLAAGLKKLPDPLWQNGHAVATLVQWPGLAKPNAIARIIADQHGFSQMLTYATLLFELTVPVALFTRWRPIWLAAGTVFHITIWLSLEVGTFTPIMLVWYTLITPRICGRKAPAKITTTLGY